MPVGIIRVDLKDELLNQYLQMDAWTPIMAAFLVCGIEPPKNCDTMSDDMLKSCSRMSGPISHARDIVTLWKSQQGARSRVAPSDFIGWCLRNNIKTSGLGEYIRNSGQISSVLLDRSIKAANPFYVSSDSLPQPKTVPSELNSNFSVKDVAVFDASSSSNAVGKKQHILKKGRNNIMTPIIKMAIENAKDKSCVHSVWLSLVDIAKRKSPPFPIIGYSIDHEVKWDNGDEPKCMTFDAFRKRMSRLATKDDNAR